jgi:hypothetical protein
MVDRYWVDHNRNVVSMNAESIKSNEDEIINSGTDDVMYHAIET